METNTVEVSEVKKAVVGLDATNLPSVSTGKENLIAEFLDNTLSLKHENALTHKKKIHNLVVPQNSKFRQDVFLAKLESNNADYSLIAGLMEFGNVVSAITECYAETYYSGYDADKITVYTAVIPEGYAARISHVKMKHLPNEYFDHNEVRLTRHMIPHSNTLHGFSAICDTCRSIWSDQKWLDISAQEIKDHYHFLSFKVYNDTKTIKSWMVGKHPDAEVFVGNTLFDHYALIGIPFGDK